MTLNVLTIIWPTSILLYIVGCILVVIGTKYKKDKIIGYGFIMMAVFGLIAISIPYLARLLFEIKT